MVVYLTPIDRDDSSYYTSYKVEIRDYSKLKHQGFINIMHLGQKINERDIFGEIAEDGSFEHLPDDFCSVSHDIGLYIAAFEVFNQYERIEFANALNLILDKSDYKYKRFESDPCFQKSLLRGGSIDSSNIRLGRSLLFDDGRFHNPFATKIKVELQGFSKFELNFSENHFSSISNVVTFIGKNGCGKSTAMYKMARLLYASEKRREALAKNVGTITPNDIAFTKMILVSYSYLDNFILPVASAQGQDTINERFYFCGVRNIRSELEKEQGKSIEDQEDPQNRDRRLKPIWTKTVRQLGEELYNNISICRSDEKKIDLYFRVLTLIKNQQPELFKSLESFEQMDDMYCSFIPKKDHVIQAFSNLSTGHKFFFHSVFGILANIMQYSFIIFDEPENYTHPPLLAFLLQVISLIANENNSVLVIATHSPVILQEVYSKNVYVVRDIDGERYVGHPSIETFAENIGIINREVFDLTPSSMEYMSTLEKIFKQMNLQAMDSFDALKYRVEQFIGSPLSMQALLFLNNRYSKRK